MNRYTDKEKLRGIRQDKIVRMWLDGEIGEKLFMVMVGKSKR